MTCEWCGHDHAREALCTKRPTWGRRGFLALFGAGIVGAMLPELPRGVPNLPPMPHWSDTLNISGWITDARPYRVAWSGPSTVLKLYDVHTEADIARSADAALEALIERARQQISTLTDD